MNLKELCEFLNIDKRAPVNFDSKEALKIGLHCQILNKDEQLSARNFNKDLWPRELGIHIPILDLEKFNHKQCFNNQFSYIYLFEMIKEQDYYDECLGNLLYACFCLFHEEGHWVDFSQSGLSGIEFMQDDFKYMEPLEDKAKRISRMADSTLKCHYAQMIEREYRNTPLEKKADSYAMESLKYNKEIILKIR